MSDNPIKKGRYKSLRRQASSIRNKKRYVERYNRHNSAVKQYRAIRSQNKAKVLHGFKIGINIFAIIILLLLIASLTRRITNGSTPSFSSLLAYLTTFDAPTIPFRDTNGLVLGFLEFVFSNAIQGFYIFLRFISFMFFG